MASPRPSMDPVIAFDSAATFRLEGKPGRIVEDVINVGPEGVFVAVAIGYGFEEERGRPLVFDLPGAPATVVPGDLTLDSIPVSALLEGFRVNPRFEHLIFETPGANGEIDRRAVRVAHFLRQTRAGKSSHRRPAPDPLRAGRNTGRNLVFLQHH